MTWLFPMQAPAGTPATIFPVPHSDWFYRFTSNQQREKQGPYDLVLDGDSITDNWQPDDRGMPVWKQRWANIKVLDNAIGGDQVPHVLWRVQHGDLDGLNPKLIMLMIGTNDCGRDPKGIAQGIRKILDEYEKRTTAHILLLGVFPRDPKPSSTRDWIKNINALISTYSSDPRVTYMDIGDKFLQPDGTLNARDHARLPAPLDQGLRDLGRRDPAGDRPVLPRCWGEIGRGISDGINVIHGIRERR